MELKKSFNKLVFKLDNDKEKKSKVNKATQFIVIDLSALTDEDIVKNSWIFTRILLISDPQSKEYNEDNIKELQLSFDGFIYSQLEEKHITNELALKKKYNDFKATFDKIYYNTTIVSSTSTKTIVDIEESEPDKIRVIKVNILYFFLSSLLSKITQLTPQISAEKESQIFYLISCDIGEFLTFVNK